MAFPRHALLLSPLPFPLHRPHYSRCDTHQSSVRSFELREEEMRISLLRSASRKVARRGGRHRPAAGAAHETQPAGAADVSHINTRALVKGFVGDDQLGEALEGDDLVIIPAGVPRKPGMPRDDLFKINAGIVKGLCTAIARHCPNWNNLELENFKDKINEVTGVMAAVYGGDHRELDKAWTLVRAPTVVMLLGWLWPHAW